MTKMKTAARPLHRHPLCAIAMGVAALTSPTWAQTGGDGARVEITGSLIKRMAVTEEGALPLSSFPAEELQARGHTELKDLMLELPQASSLGSFAGTAGPMTSLRGFGPMRTLTLLNGRRLAKEPLTNQYVSVSAMPRMALSRTDILRDGASSAYGSDAIAGVQAFYTHNKFNGVKLKAETLTPEREGGGDYWSVGAIGGFGKLDSDGWNVYVAAEMQRRKILPRESRPELISGEALNALGIATAPGQGVNAVPANFTDPTHPTASQRTLRYNPGYATGCLAPYSEPSTSGGRQTCFLDANDTYTAWGNGNHIDTLFGKGTVMLGKHQLSAEINLAKFKVLQRNAPIPVTVRLNSTHPYYPGNGVVPAVAGLNLGGRPIDATWSVADLGPRERGDYHTNERAVVSLEGTIGSWDYRAGLNYGRSERDTRAESGWARVTGLATVQGTATTLFLDPRLNPFGLQNAAGLALLQSATIDGQSLRIHQGKNESVDFTASGELFNLPGGATTLALGAELRKDGWRAIGLASNDPKASLNNQIDLFGGDAQAQGAVTSSSNQISRTITSAFAEMELPVTKTLSFNLAARADKYDDLGETTLNPKVALRWQPIKNAVIRASANTGFRAPALPEIYSKETERTAIPVFDDPKLCPQVNGADAPAAGYTAAQVCNLTGFNQITKIPGNSSIQPEKSKSRTAGFAFEPTKGFTVSADYWQTEITNVIGNRAITFILLNHTLYTDLFRRNADGTLAQDAVFNPPSNLGKIKASGVDVSWNVALAPSAIGRLSFGMDIAYLTRWDAATPEVAGGAYVSALAQYNDVVPVNPNAGLSNATRGLNNRWRHTAQVTWGFGSWETQLSQRYQSKVRDQNLPARTGAGTSGPRDVAAYEQFNLVVSYSGVKGLKLSGAVTNLFDRSPPQTNHNGYFGYLTSSVDVLGRAYRLTAEYKF